MIYFTKSINIKDFSPFLLFFSPLAETEKPFHRVCSELHSPGASRYIKTLRQLSTTNFLFCVPYANECESVCEKYVVCLVSSELAAKALAFFFL